MKNKIKKCSICNESILDKNRKSHLLCYHLDDNLDLVLAEFYKYSIYSFTDQEKVLLNKRVEPNNVNSDSIELFLFQIKLKQFEQKIAQMMQIKYIDDILDDCNSISLALTKLKEEVNDLHQQGMINKMIERIENILLKTPTKDVYNLDSEVCIFCSHRIVKSKLREHLIITHRHKNSTELENAMLYYSPKLTDLDYQVLNKKRLAEQQQQIKEKKKKEEKRKKLEKEFEHSVDIRYFIFEKEINELRDTDYIEAVDSKIVDIKYNLKKLKDTAIFGKVEERKNNLLLQQLVNYENTIPTREDFIKDYCTKIYITWDDVYFERNKIYITANKGIIQPIAVQGSLSILNEIKVEYFRRVFKHEVFKLIVKNGQIRKDLSKDLAKIEEHISERIKEIQTVKNWQKIKHDPIFSGLMDKEEIIKFINTQSVKNSFLKYPATLLNQNDNVKALLEINNGIEEEALLFIFRREKYGLLLWENINSNRAAYIFCFDIKKLSSNISGIVQLITANAEYKRENLFRGVDIRKAYNINCIFYRSVIHDYQIDYKNNLDRIFKF